MTPAEFSKALLQSAKALDVPAAGAKARAVAHVATASGAVGAAGAGAAGGAALAGGAAAASKGGLVVWSLAAAAVVTAGVVGIALTREPAQPPAPVAAGVSSGGAASVPAASMPGPDAPRGAAPAVASSHEEATGTLADACMVHPLADGPPATCSKKGKPVPFDLRNTCAGDVDVFWVGYDCQEIFHHRLANGESWKQVTQDAHVWRVRDHATHALVKEFSAQRLPGAPDLSHLADAPPRVLADVVVHDVDASTASTAEEKPPSVCSGMGALSKTTIKNERDAQIVIIWVGLDCKEKY